MFRRIVVLLVVAVTAFTSAAGVNGADPSAIAERLKGVKLINYYPAQHAQTRMWTDWPADGIDHDLAAIADLHANTVRVAVYIDAFGFPRPKDEMLDRLKQFLTLADKHGLRVKLALFGFFHRYQDVAGSTEWMEAVLKDLKSDRRIAYLDLYNELPIDRPGVAAWAVQMLPRLRLAAGDIPVTVSLSGSAGVRGLVALKNALDAASAAVQGPPLVDFYEFHYYGQASLAFRAFAGARRAVAPVPIFIGEFGYSTNPTSRQHNDHYSDSWWEAFQSQYYRTILYAAKGAALPPPAPWTFSDFVPGAFQTASPETDAAERAMGFYRADGTPKPAAAALRRYFDGGEVGDEFNNGFERADDRGSALNWLLWKPELGTLRRDTSVSHSGQASVSISQTANTPAGVPAFMVSPVKYIEPGSSYHASVWAKGRGVTGRTQFALAWFDAAGKYISTSSSATKVPPEDSDWRRLEIGATAPANAASVEIHLGSSNDRGTIWFDDVTFE